MSSSNSPFPKRPAKRSPFPDPSLPQAGESLRDQAYELFFDRFLFYLITGLTLVGVAAIDWILYALGEHRSRWIWTVIGTWYCALAAYRYWRIGPQLKAIHQGLRGERMVGRSLEQLRTQGYEVFHDLPGDGFNVDHVLIGPGGVFVIETKTISKPTGQNAQIDYDGQRVIVPGCKTDRDPIAQVQAGAAHIADLLKKMTGHDVPIRPVVLFPGWFINTRAKNSRTWVLNEKALPKFLAHESAKLPREDAALYTDRLTRHLQTERAK